MGNDEARLKLFVIWSGARSWAVAQAISSWLPDVLQAIQPWFSSEDMQAGQRWSHVISTELGRTHFGIACVTPENAKEPWIHFESGALAKSVEGSGVIPYLFGFEKATDLGDPLGMFQGKLADKEGTFAVVQSLNKRLPNPLSDGSLSRVFDALWPQLERKLQAVPAFKQDSKTRDLDEVLSEILQSVREILRRSDRVDGPTAGEWAARESMWVRLARLNLKSEFDREALIELLTKKLPPSDVRDVPEEGSNG